MKKRRIVIASVLKPVDDTRMYEKMGMTLGKTGQYEVFIIGQPSKGMPARPDIHFRALKAFSRISLGRLLAPLKIQRIINKVKPDIVIVNTHELLIVALLNRILFGSRIIYDVRENYLRNILYGRTFPFALRPLLGGCVRLKEWLIAPFINRFFLAEKGYLSEMSFFGGRPIIIENKAAESPDFVRHSDPSRIRLLFSGTIAESTGIFQAIDLAKRLFRLDSRIELTIIGFCPQNGTLMKVLSAIENQSFIKLLGGDQLIPHPDIVRAIYASDFGLVCYPPARHTENSIPTKLYEYLAARLPILLQQHPPWLALCAPFPAAVAVDYAAPDAGAILGQMQSTFYSSTPEGVFWKSEGEKLIAAIAEI